MRNSSALKQLMTRRAAVIAPGAANALFARVIEDLGFECVYISGAGVANMRLGAPDVGLTTLTELADTVAAVADAVNLPLIVDADTGFGNAVNMVRTVRVLERMGAAGKQVIPVQDMLQKVRAAVDARHDSDLQIIVRTDARAIEGLDRAIDRACAFVEAGADVTFVEAPVNLDELARIPREVQVPQVANIVFGGKTPDPGHEKLKEMGFAIVLYANATLQAALKAAHDVLKALKSDGSLASVADRLASFEERQDAVAKGTWDALEARYTQVL
jgi:2-methylisocitrate lyase-like PEP mutase family enzyme